MVFDRATGTSSGGTGAANVASRRAVGRLSFEGIALYPNGVMYYGDEHRPASGTPGGAYFKFVPDDSMGGGTITEPEPVAADRRARSTDCASASGRQHRLRPGLQHGPRNWVRDRDREHADLRAAAAALKLTGYYRPEDIDIDARSSGQGQVRFCGNNTGNEIDDHNWGEAICITDGTLAEATANTAIPEVQYLVVGTPELAMMDNMAYQPGRGNWILHEDGDGPEVGATTTCGPVSRTAKDDDSLSDGCVRVATLNDLTPSGRAGSSTPTDAASSSACSTTSPATA